MVTRKTARVERELLSRLETSWGKDREVLVDIAELYQMAGRVDEAIVCVERLLPLAADREESVAFLLSAGQLSEQKNDYVAAERYYRCAQGLEPKDLRVRYFVHNNLGFCLNQLGRFEEAMPYLEEAQRIDPRRCNAFKNLGLAFQGMGRYEKAVELFVAATRASATDVRSLRHLEELAAEHPELYDSVPTLVWMLRECRRAVAQARAAGPMVH